MRTATHLVDVLETLSAIAAPCGNEDRMVAHVSDQLRALGLVPEVDRIGNVAARVGPANGAPLLVFAHLDELGLAVRAVDPDGFIRVERVGGVPERVLPGTPMVVHTHTADVPAVVGLKAHHLTPPEEKYVARPVAELYLDAGFSSAEDAQRHGLRAGDPVTYAPTFTRLAGGRVAGKSMDDRAAVAALLELAARLVDLPPRSSAWIAFSVQEEFNVRGTLALAERLRPAMAIQVDVAPACDTPDLRHFTPVRLGGGPVLTRLSFHGRGTLGGLIPHPVLLGALEAAAERIGLHVQHQAIVGLITDAAFLPMAGGDGIAAAEVGIPARYTHSPVETIQLSDVEATVELLEAFVREAGQLDLARGAALVRRGGMS